MSKKVVLSNDEISMLSVIESNQNIEEVFNILKSTDGGWVLIAIEKRFEVQNLIPDHKVMVAILYLGECAIGKCVKFVDEIYMWAQKNNEKNINWNKFNNEVYSFSKN